MDETVLVVHVTHNIGYDLDETYIFENSPAGIQHAFDRIKTTLEDVKNGYDKYIIDPEKWPGLEEEYKKSISEDKEYFDYNSYCTISIKVQEVEV